MKGERESGGYMMSYLFYFNCMNKFNYIFIAE
jgi:hypothetical protein